MAALNEVVWRTMDTDTWVAFKTVSAPAAIVCYVIITNLIARRYWLVKQEVSR